MKPNTAAHVSTKALHGRWPHTLRYILLIRTIHSAQSNYVSWCGTENAGTEATRGLAMKTTPGESHWNVEGVLSIAELSDSLSLSPISPLPPLLSRIQEAFCRRCQLVSPRVLDSQQLSEEDRKQPSSVSESVVCKEPLSSSPSTYYLPPPKAKAAIKDYHLASALLPCCRWLQGMCFIIKVMSVLVNCSP